MGGMLMIGDRNCEMTATPRRPKRSPRPLAVVGVTQMPTRCNVLSMPMPARDSSHDHEAYAPNHHNRTENSQSVSPLMPTAEAEEIATEYVAVAKVCGMYGRAGGG